MWRPTVTNAPPSGPAATRSREHRAPRVDVLVGLLAAVTVSVAAWMPFLHTPLGSDESGYLLVGRHWTDGTSLYGNYWVDRPPLLIWLFSLAARLGPVTSSHAGVVAPAVKVLGLVATGISLLVIGVLAHVAPATRGARRTAVLLGAVLLVSPLLGIPEVDGELLALPFVLIGLACLIDAWTRPTSPRAFVMAAASGAAGAGAALTKQDFVDVFVFAVTAWFVARVQGPRLGRRHALSFACGSAAVLALALSGASLQGTSAGGLWEAVVLFRLRASRVIGASDTVASSTRLWHLVGVAVESGALVLLVLTIGLAVHSAYRRTPLRVTPNLTWPALALAAWEVCAVALGGSYWHHYLTGLVPGLVLLTTIATPGAWGRRLLTATLAYATMVNLSVWAGRATSPVTGTTDAQVEAFLRAHARPSDGVVVAFGHPDIVAGSGLASPYPELWSLPVHVRDPDLHVLQRVLSGAAAPRWVVVGGSSLASWGLEAGPAEAYLLRHYVERAAYGGWRVWQREAPSSGRTTRPQS